jgi:hypothetical protein
MHPLVAQQYEKIPETLRPFVPVEGLIDKAIKGLVSKFVTNGSFTPKEQRDFDDLNDERVWRMGGRLPDRHRPQRRLLSFFRR